MNKVNNLWLLIVFLGFGLGSALPYPSGVSGYTKKSGTAGCGCHGSSYYNTTVLVRIVGPDTVKVNTTTTYQVIVSAGPSTKAGVDIAAQNGTLTAVSTYLKKSGTELTHSSSVSYTSNQVIFEFKLTTGATLGTETLYATGSSKKYWNWATNKTIAVVGDAPTGIADLAAPADFDLEQNYPNPFNPTTNIRFTTTGTAPVSIDLYTVAGVKIAELSNGIYPAGIHRVTVDAEKLNLSSGTYLYTLRSGKANLTRKMLLIK